MNVYEIQKIEELDRIRETWSQLLSQMGNATFFHTLDWLEVYWKHFSQDQQLRVIVAEDNGEVIGIVPLVVRRQMTKVGKLRYLTFPLDDWGSQYGPIGTNAESFLPDVLEYIFQSARNWEIFELRCLHSEDATNEVLSAFKQVNQTAYASPWDETAIIDLDGTYEEYLKSKNKSFRKSLKQNEKRCFQAGNVQLIRYRPKGIEFNDYDPRWDLYNACEEIARKSWQGSSTTGTTLSHESVKPFLRESHQIACQLGAVDINLFTISGTPIAFD